MIKTSQHVRRIRGDVKAAQDRGADLCSMHPPEVAVWLDPMVQDRVYPLPLRQAAAKGRLTPLAWEASVRAGWQRERIAQAAEMERQAK